MEVGAVAKRFIIEEVNSNDEDFLSHIAHQEMLDKECIIASLKLDEIAWLFVHFPEEEGNEWHRLRTSTVKYISYEDDVVVFNTENTNYRLKMKGEENE